MGVRLLVVRPLPGTVGERRRVAHLVPLVGTERMPERLTACCGQSFGPDELELLDGMRGMPCESCLLQAPAVESAELTAGAESGVEVRWNEVSDRLAVIDARLGSVVEQVAALRSVVAELLKPRSEA